MDYHEFYTNPELLSSPDLKGREVRVRVDKVIPEDFESDGQKKRRLVASFHGKSKRLPLNRTNADTLAIIAGTNDPTRWSNLDIVLFTIPTQYKGRPTDGIRIKATSPSQAPSSTPTTPPPPAATTDFANQNEDDDPPF